MTASCLRFPDTEEPPDSEIFLLDAAEADGSCPAPTRVNRLSSPPSSARAPRERCCCPSAAPGARAPLWQTAQTLRRSARRRFALSCHFQFCSKPIANACAISSICRHFSKSCEGSQRGDSRHDARTRRALALRVVAFVFATSPTISTTAMPRLPSAAPRRSRSINRSLEESARRHGSRELLDAAAIDEVESRLQMLDAQYHAKHEDGIHDMLLRLGDLTEPEISARASEVDVHRALADLLASRRVLRVRVAGETRYVPVEYAARYRDAFGAPLPPGLAEVFLQSVSDPLSEIVRRYARIHGPFTVTDVARRYALEAIAIEPILHTLHAQGKLLEGEFLPKGTHREWCDPEILQQIRRKSLSNLRREIEPVEQKTLSRLLTRWQGAHVPRKGLDALLDAIEVLQGASLLASDLEREILPARVAGYQPGDLDTLMSAGEVVWTGVEQVGEHDGRLALYLTEALPLLAPPSEGLAEPSPLSEVARQIEGFLANNGASFFPEIRAACGGGFSGEILDALWELVWRGDVTNDTFHTVRSRLYPPSRKNERKDGPAGSPEFLRRLRARKTGDGIAAGRWSLLRNRKSASISVTEWSANSAQQLLTRYGIVTRETALAEGLPGGYNTIYPALRKMEESGLIRRGMFVAGLGAAQFAMPAAVDLLRTLRSPSHEPESTVLAATDPANPYGAILPWTTSEADTSAVGSHAMARVSGASVVLVNGVLSAFLRRKNPSIKVFLPESEPERSQVASKLARQLAELAVRRQQRTRSGLLISKINDLAAKEHFLGRFLEEAGFSDTATGYYMRRVASIATAVLEEDEADTSETPGASESA